MNWVITSNGLKIKQKTFRSKLIVGHTRYAETIQVLEHFECLPLILSKIYEAIDFSSDFKIYQESYILTFWNTLLI